MGNSYEVGASFADVDGVRLHYARTGDPTGPTLALVNMASHNLTCWEPLLAELEADFDVVRFDIRGTGRSGWGNDSDFTFARYADDLAGLLDHLHVERAVVVGVAYGARTAARFAIDHADKLAGLGLFDVALTPPVEQTGQRELAEQARALLAEAGEPEVELQKYWRFYENRDAALAAHTAHEREPDTTDMLGHVTVPAMVACGRQDMNLEQAERIAAAIPGSRFEVMEMTGHASPFFRPALVASLIGELVRATR